MKLRHLFTVVFAVFMTLMSLTGCNSERKYIGEKTERLLHEKYGKTFEVIYVYKNSHGGGWYGVDVYDTDYPDMPIEISMDVKDDLFDDDYVHRLKCRELSETVKDNISGIAPDYYVYSEALGFAYPWFDDPNITLREYIDKNKEESKTFFISVDVFAKKDSFDPDKAYDALVNAFDGIEYTGGNIHIVLTDEKAYEDAKKELQTTTSTWDLQMEILDDAVFVFVPYDDGKIAVSKDEFIKSYTEAIEKNEKK